MTGRNKCTFSIDHILNVAGNVPSTKFLHFDWLNCTRYHPPRIQRPKKKEGVQRRNAGRNPRIPFSPQQVAILESKFHTTPYLSSHEVQQIADQLQLSEVRVKIWFQNRRARERREQEPQKARQAEVAYATTVDKISSPTMEDEATKALPETTMLEIKSTKDLPLDLKKDNAKLNAAAAASSNKMNKLLILRSSHFSDIF